MSFDQPILIATAASICRISIEIIDNTTLRISLNPSFSLLYLKTTINTKSGEMIAQNQINRAKSSHMKKKMNDL